MSGGEIINFSSSLSRGAKYSSKVITILFPAKSRAPFSGMLLTTFGGVISLGPPEGAACLAQLKITEIVAVIIIQERYEQPFIS
jgi:hypothetical protein